MDKSGCYLIYFTFSNNSRGNSEAGFPTATSVIQVAYTIYDVLADLEYKGRPFAETIAEEMSSMGLPCYLSIANYEQVVPAGWKTADGRLQTTFGWYSVNCISVMRQDIESSKYKLLRSIDKLRCRVIDAADAGLDDSVFKNVNHPEDYLDLNR